MAKKNKATVLDAMTAASSSIINQCLQTTLWAAAALRNRARLVVSRGASEVLAALCAELGRGGVVAYKC